MDRKGPSEDSYCVDSISETKAQGRNTLGIKSKEGQSDDSEPKHCALKPGERSAKDPTPESCPLSTRLTVAYAYHTHAHANNKIEIKNPRSQQGRADVFAVSDSVAGSSGDSW